MFRNIVCARSLCSGQWALSKEAKLQRSVVAIAVALICAGCSLFEKETTPPSPPPRLDEATVRQFATEQQIAWNAQNFDHFYSLCAPDAVFVSIHWNSDGSITREQRTLEQDRAAAEHFFAGHPDKFIETDTIDSIKVAPDGFSARILGHQTARFVARGHQQVLHASTDQTVALRSGRLVSLGQTDTTER
jgi:hypothetical protein